MALTTTFKQRRAVLVSGGISEFQNHRRYLHNLHIFYSLLVSPRYRFHPRDIEVLYANGGSYHFAGNAVATEEATEANLKDALDDALNATGHFVGTAASPNLPLGSNDLLIFMSTNHGDDSTPPHRLLLWDPSQYITSTGFASAIKSASKCHFLGVFGHCYGGSMISKTLSAIGGANKCVCVAASTSASYALEPDYAYDAFLYHFTSALLGKTPANYTADADANGDGLIDLDEAFKFAMRMDSTKDIPTIDDGGSGMRSKMTLEGLI